MNERELEQSLEFLRAAEALKVMRRSGWTTAGEPESVAAHSWRLALMAFIFAQEMPELDLGRLLALCVVHDLGEAIGGDVPAPLQVGSTSRAERERADLAELAQPLPERTRTALLALWDEYHEAGTPEARIARGLDKLETILQHNQGRNPPDFDYLFNVGYGRRYTEAHPLLAEARALLDAETEARAAAQGG